MNTTVVSFVLKFDPEPATNQKIAILCGVDETLKSTEGLGPATNEALTCASPMEKNETRFL